MKPRSGPGKKNSPAEKAAGPPAVPNRSRPAFPIIGIGASAGGLEALDRFLRHLPEDCGLALVVIQHLDPTRPGMLVQLLQRSTTLVVVQAEDHQVVKPGHVYVIPPGKNLSVLRGCLYLFPPLEARGLRLPINFFFQSLALDRANHAIGVILSGMGSDGMLGAKAIKEKGGLILVQDPATARSDGMPGSVVREGIADLVGEPGLLASDLVRILRRDMNLVAQGPFVPESEKSSFEKICILLRDRSGHDFSLYKKTTLYRRIERRMRIHTIAAIASYVHYLQKNPQELDFLFKELLIGVTGFFRDPEAWHQLAEDVLPAIMATYPKGGTLRAWVAGCSTGEEAYSLAIAFREVLERLKPETTFNLQVFATDLDQDAIKKARQGFFLAKAMGGISDERRTAWFIQEENGFRLRKEIREMLVFAPQDVLQDPPFIRLDLLLCRNLLIYLSAELQNQLLLLFHYSLNPDGCLFLGNAESVGVYSDLFVSYPGKSRLFRHKESDRMISIVKFPKMPPSLRETPAQEPAMKKTAANLQTLADQVLLQRFAPAAVLTSEEGDILYINGRTGKYLEPAMGKANWNIFAMAREGLRTELGMAFRKAIGQKEPVAVHGIRVSTDGGLTTVDLTVQTLDNPEVLRGMVMIVFSDQPALPHGKVAKARKGAPADPARVAEVEAELLSCKEEMQGLREEMQTSQEELKATNEELQSTNEELQSTNEELTTSKEELQSLNEELQTVNAEQETKVEELSVINNDMKNLLDATEIATLFLDERLLVRRFTNGATRLFKLIPGDVGRPITDIVNSLDYPGLEVDAMNVLSTLMFSEKDVSTLKGNAWFSTRILPYRTLKNTLEGVVITFTEITRAKALEAQLREGIPGGPLSENKPI